MQSRDVVSFAVAVTVAGVAMPAISLLVIVVGSNKGAWVCWNATVASGTGVFVHCCRADVPDRDPLLHRRAGVRE